MTVESFKLVCLWLIMFLYFAQAVVLFLTGDKGMALAFASYAVSCIGFLWSMS